MNKYKTLSDRQGLTTVLLAQELDLIDKRGLNPITKLYPRGPEVIHEISPDLPFIQAMKEGRKKMTAGSGTLMDIDCTLNQVEKACGKLWDNAVAGSYLNLTISQISRKHIKYILEQCGRDNPRWSNNRHNRYIDNLSMVFKTLKGFEVIETNPTVEIERLQHIPTTREILTDEEMETIEKSLKSRVYTFWRYMRIFFKSGSRTTELLALKKGPDIMVEKQEFVVIVRKGKKHKRDIRIIHDEVLDLWMEVLEQAKPGEFLFSEGLRPGPRMIRKDQVCRRWNKYVKKDINKVNPEKGGLGIKKDFYSLKHKNLDGITQAAGIDAAQLAGGHSTPVVTLNNYAVGEKQRQRDRLKKLPTIISK
jgi:integrase